MEALKKLLDLLSSSERRHAGVLMAMILAMAFLAGVVFVGFTIFEDAEPFRKPNTSSA